MLVLTSDDSDIWVRWFTNDISINRALFIGVYFIFASAAAFLTLGSFWRVHQEPQALKDRHSYETGG